MKIKIQNTFHNTECNLIVDGTPEDGQYTITGSQFRRLNRTLCGISDCCCGTIRDPKYIVDQNCLWGDNGATISAKY